MADTNRSVAVIATGVDNSFQLTLNGPGGEQSFAIAIADIPTLVQSLTAVAWASAATNRPPPGTKLPPVSAFPVKFCEVGTIQGSPDPVLAVELFGGVKIGLHFTLANAQATGETLTRLAGPSPLKN